MNAVFKAVLAFVLCFAITFQCLHYLPGLKHYSLEPEGPLSASEAARGAVFGGMIGALISLKKRN